MGNIGQRVARFAEMIGMQVMYWDKFDANVSYPKKEMEEVLAKADVISIHLHLTAETEGLIGEQALQMMKPHAYLINTARGQIIDQVALRKALQNGKLAGFAADVLAKEPPTAHEPLLSMPNVLITPHSGSLTATTFRNMCVLSVNNVIAVLEGKEPKAGCIFNEKALV
jgi:phosphoglycerate dehydrogenase-like enzyme